MSEIVRIEKMVYGGAGLARGQNGVVFVQGSIPGELVRMEPDGFEGGVARGKLIELLESSSDRRDPPCAYFGVCGGCDLQFMEYEAQLSCKKEVFQDCLSRIGKIKHLPQTEVIADKEFGYRLRVQIKNDQNGAGFYKRKTNEIVAIRNCPLLVDNLNQLLFALNSRNADIPSVTSIKAISGKRVVASSPVISGLTESETEIEVGKYRFSVQGDSFFQANRFLLEKLGLWAKPYLKGNFCLDLYGGTGFFSVMLSDLFEEVVLVENMADQVKAARENFHQNGLSHFRAVQADIERGSGLEAVPRKKPDCVIVDPPRPGLGRKARTWLAGLAPDYLLYISCNPSTFARDAQFFIKECGYEITNCAIFDLYPNTHHLESAVIFHRK